MKLKPVDIAGLSPADGLIELPESSLWFWNYEVWRFKSRNPASPIAAIGWKFILPNGKWSTDKKYSVLLDSIKNVAYGMLSNKSYGKSLSVGTLGSIGVGLGELFKWLISKRLLSLAELTPARIKQYRSNLRDILLDRNAFYGSPSVSVIAANETVEEENLYEIYEVELAARFNRRDYTALDSKPAQLDSSPVRNGVSRKKTTGLTGECRTQGEDDAISDARDAEEAEEHLADGGFSYAQVSYRLLALLYCHAQRNLLLSKRLPIMPNEPYPKEDIGQLTRQLAKFIVNRIPAVPDLVANRILSSVLEWIDVYGPAFEDVLRNYSELRRLGREDPKATVDYSELIKRFDSKIPVLSTTTEIAWREPRFEGEETLPEAVPDIHHRMRLAALFVRDACSLAIQFLAGLRVSEICSTKAEAEKNKDMAGCIELKSSHHGLFNLFSIAGVTIKGRQRPLATQWIVGGTPKGSNELPVIVKAVNLLHKITYILQPKAKQTALF